MDAENEDVDDKQLFDKITELYVSVEASSSPTTTIEKDIDALKASVPFQYKRERILWSRSNDQLIMGALRRHGTQWRKIARELKIGSDDAIRNRVARLEVDGLPSDVKGIVVKLHEKRINNSRIRREGGPRHLPWNTYEDTLIDIELKNGRYGAWTRLFEGPLSHRTKHSIRNRAARLHLI